MQHKLIIHFIHSHTQFTPGTDLKETNTVFCQFNIKLQKPKVNSHFTRSLLLSRFKQFFPEVFNLLSKECF